MRVRAGRILIALLIAVCGPATAPALADGPVGADPSSNFPVGSLPAACDTAPTGAVCINASVNYLDQARASLGQPAYTLPADFAALSPEEQALILTNSDRVLYNLPPMAGLTAQLDQDAAATLATDEDPQPSTSQWQGYTSNSSWGDDNMVLAYGGWMYDDGPGSNNVDCTASTPSGCWIHRHDILWEFDPGPLAMGVASGRDSGGNPSYTMLLMVGNATYSPTYTYTWAQAVADGAGGARGGGSGSQGPGGTGGGARAHGARDEIRIRSVKVRGHRLIVRLTGSSRRRARCVLVRAGQHHVVRAKRCGRRVSFARVRSGRYRLRVSSRARVLLTRRVRIR